MIILRQKEFGNKANKAAQRKWKIEQALKNEEAKAGDYHYANSSERKKMMEEAKRTGKLPYGIGGSGSAKSASEVNKLHKKESSNVINYQPKYTDYTKEESALRKSRERNKVITDPIAQREIDTRSTIKLDSKGNIVGGGTYAKKVSDKQLQEEQQFWNDSKRNDIKVERKSDYEMRKKAEDLKNKKIESMPKTTNNTNKVQGKVGGYIKKAWNGEVGMGKTGNRAAMIGVPILAAGGTALALRKKREKKEE